MIELPDVVKLKLAVDENLYWVKGELSELVRESRLNVADVIESPSSHTKFEIEPGALGNTFIGVPSNYITKGIYLLEIPEGRIVTDSAAIITPDNRLVNHCAWKLRNFGNRFISCYNHDDSCYLNTSESPRNYDKNIFVPHVSDWTSLDHWIYQVIPALYYYREKLLPKGTVLNLPQIKPGSFQEKSIEILLGDVSYETCLDNFVKARNALIPFGILNSGSIGKIFFDSVDFFKNKLKSNGIESQKNLSGKIFFTSKSARSQIGNYEEIEKFLATEGFSFIDIFDVSFVDIVATYSSPSIVMGLTGEHSSFMPLLINNSNVIELASQMKCTNSLNLVSSYLRSRYFCVEPVLNEYGVDVIKYIVNSIEK